MSNAALEKVQYVSDQNGNLTGVFLPIEVWRELESMPWRVARAVQSTS
jgi:hypothetical protein